MEEKRRRLRELLNEYAKEDVCLAFSGGIDSSLLLYLCQEAAVRNKRKLYAVTFDTVLHPPCDKETAERVAREAGAIHKIIVVDELKQQEIRHNPKNRCYLCKKALYEQMLSYGEKKGIHTLIEGSNEDDLHVYRPGLTAVKELGVKSPLAYLHITKEEVRSLAREYGIPVADRPSSPCLATRLPYGTEIDLELLNRIDQGEEYLRGLGFYNVRMRVHGDIVRLEVDEKDFSALLGHRREIVQKLKELGFPYITLDLEGFRSGSMDQIQTRDNSEI